MLKSLKQIKSELLGLQKIRDVIQKRMDETKALEEMLLKYNITDLDDRTSNVKKKYLTFDSFLNQIDNDVSKPKKKYLTFDDFTHQLVERKIIPESSSKKVAKRILICLEYMNENGTISKLARKRKLLKYDYIYGIHTLLVSSKLINEIVDNYDFLLIEV